ncbi:MAG: hypothetical protein LBK53_06425 [Heliobacteriaceae bacterium]|jgi:hypothetical protein|nr:hypothetical protein [Heliobacteriaceae bacterium]
MKTTNVTSVNFQGYKQNFTITDISKIINKKFTGEKLDLYISQKIEPALAALKRSYSDDPNTDVELILGNAGLVTAKIKSSGKNSSTKFRLYKKFNEVPQKIEAQVSMIDGISELQQWLSWPIKPPIRD